MTVRVKLAWLAVALAAGCGTDVTPGPGPLDRIRLPTGMAVHDGRVLVASSNSDLLYDEVEGGSVISLEPVSLDTVRIAGAVRVRSFAGDLAVARTEERGAGVPDAEACGTTLAAPLAVFGTRGSNTLNLLSIEAGGALRPVASLSAGSGLGDPVATAIACGAGRARAFTGYLTATGGVAFVTELDLVPSSSGSHAIRTVALGAGPIRGFAYDRDRDRLYMVGLAASLPTPLRWLELAGCTVGLAVGAGGCPVGQATLGVTASTGIELRSIALANPTTPGIPRAAGAPIRAYVTGRVYDAAAAALAGFRDTEFGGILLVVDLVEDALGGVDPQVVWSVPIGRGAQEVRVLPRSATWAPDRRDVVAAISVGAGELTIYDDETRSVAVFRTDELTGAPFLGHSPYGLAVDPVAVGTAATVWVGSYGDGFVTPIEVPLDAPDRAAFAGGSQRRFSGATP